MTELQLGKYEFYPNEGELQRRKWTDSFFERDGSDLEDKSIEELLEQLESETNSHRR